MAITVSPEEARAIAKEAYLYGWPMSENYNTIHAYSIDDSPENENYKAPFNVIHNEANVFTPEDTTVVTPNSDTPYSFISGDLRAEPLVITTPPMTPSSRYFSFQLVDLYTFNFDYIGTRTGHNAGGNFVILGPSWTGPDPTGFTAVFRCETELFLSITRTQLFNPGDLSNVEAIQQQYAVQTLSQYLDQAAPTPAPTIAWPQPCTGEASKTPAIFAIINFLLQFCPTVPSEIELMKEFAKIGVGAGLPFDPASLSPEMLAAFEAGIADAWKEFEQVNAQVAAGELSTADFFGTRLYLDNNYLYRFAGAKIGIYGNSKEEANYQMYMVDADMLPLDASSNRYTLKLTEALPAKAFASVTMYDGRTQLLIKNPIARYLINTPMLDQLLRGDDGSITIYVQKDSPGTELEPNWLPAPDATFYMVMRLYVPEQNVIDGEWTPPPVHRA
ncbi:MAG: DUF1254 domain-containing protein [Thermoanaerobaculia bacterium]|nr:DUF1254 domain-containing protein [Thermoanaerobaculia bacterium]